MIFEGMKIELWVIFQIAIDLILVILILWLLKNLKTGMQQNVSQNTVEQVVEMLEPLLSEAENISNAFGKQLQEKNHLIRKLNEKLDSRIISLNLLLNRANALALKGDGKSLNQPLHVYDQQESIVQLYKNGHTSREIAQTLSLPQGEVDLVLDLKKKLRKIK